MNKYIGENRLTYLWGKIKAFVSNAISGKVDKVSSSTDNAVVRFDGVSGNMQNSGVTIDDSNHLTAAKLITSGGTSSQFVKGDGTLDSTSYASLASPVLTGTPTAPTAASGTNTTQIATTEFVQNALPKSVATYNITLGATLSEGWYRVAKLGHSFSGIVYMMGIYASAKPTVATFAISGKAINVGCDIIQLSGTAESGGISKVRLVSDENDDDVFYFDIYKAVSTNISTTYLTFNGIYANLADATSTTVLTTASTYVRKVCDIKTITEDMYVTTSTFNETVGNIETLLASI